MATNKPRYTVSVDNDLFQQIEDYRFKYRFQTRSEATVELIRIGLACEKSFQEAKEEIINNPEIEDHEKLIEMFKKSLKDGFNYGEDLADAMIKKQTN